MNNKKSKMKALPIDEHFISPLTLKRNKILNSSARSVKHTKSPDSDRESLKRSKNNLHS